MRNQKNQFRKKSLLKGRRNPLQISSENSSAVATKVCEVIPTNNNHHHLDGSSITKTEFSPILKSPANNNARSAMQVGEMFCHYQIQKELGHGGMGVVYKALDTKLHRIVALKLTLAFWSNPQEEQRFQQEAKAIAQLKHPNIVQLFEIGEPPNNYFTMEYIEGETLSYLVKGGKIKLKSVVHILIKAAGAIYEAHRKGIIHRDIKPSNIMIQNNGEPKIMDFGLAKVANIDSQLSQTGATLGTPSYMSPEQADGKQVHKTTDIYSLGATLYEALTGRPPFQGETAFNILSQILIDDPIAPRKLNPDIPKELEAICLKCLNKNPKKRYSNARQLEKDLINFLEHRPIVARPLTSSVYIKKYIWRHKLLCTTLFIVVMTLLTAILSHISYTKELKQQKDIAERLKEKAEKEREYSVQAAKEMFKALDQIYQENDELEGDLKMVKGLKKVFQELDRLQVLKNLTDKNEEHVLSLYGLVYGGSKNPKEFQRGIQAYSQLIKKNPKNARAYHNRGYLHYKQRDYKKAEKDYNKALKYASKAGAGKIYCNRGLLYQQQGHYKKAEQDLTKAIELNPKSYSAYNNRGLLYRKQRQYQKAHQDYNKAIEVIKVSSVYSNAYMNRGVLYQKQLLYQKAMQDFERAIRANSKNAGAYLNRGALYQKQKLYQKAKIDFDRAIELNSEFARAYNHRGTLYLMQGLYHKAELDLTKAIELNPKYANAYANRGRVYKFLKQYNKAIADWQKAIDFGLHQKETVRKWIERIKRQKD